MNYSMADQINIAMTVGSMMGYLPGHLTDNLRIKMCSSLDQMSVVNLGFQKIFCQIVEFHKVLVTIFEYFTANWMT